MPKLLKPYTIVPGYLYVRRDADRQLANVIREMGRPGYILVSRQMGKTNMLLNAKRELETADDSFIYIDLSNPFDTLDACFENIIDLIIETNSRKFKEANDIIKKKREQSAGLPSHKQHISELRVLLNSIKGKLVIILDEIDAIAKKTYSEQLFALIRSIYFARVNFPELERLTYIFSGVIEPTDLIKDSNISPFNIGQKIFLSDFSRSEFEDFLSKAHLELSPKLKDRIFYWTNGNPRMTWEICSAIEIIGETYLVTLKSIDRIVEELYLTTFNKPPIDNIRQLVKNDKEIRNAIIEMEYKQNCSIPDSIKSKLYLAGIVNYQESDVSIKNNIIKRSLNIDWLKEIEEKEKGLLQIGVDYFHTGNFKEALKVFDKFLEDGVFEENDARTYYYYSAYSAYKCSDFKKAIKYLELLNVLESIDKEFYFTVLNLKGLANYYENNINKSLACFTEIIKNGKIYRTYLLALFYFGNISVNSYSETFKTESLGTFRDALSKINQDGNQFSEEFIFEIKSIAHFYIGKLLSQQRRFEEAQENYQAALLFSKHQTQPLIYLNLIDITGGFIKDKLVAELVDLVVDRKLQPVIIGPENPLEFSFQNFKDLAIICYISYRHTLFKKLKSRLNVLGQGSMAFLIYQLSIYAINDTQKIENAKYILSALYDNRYSIEYSFDILTLLHTTRLLAYLSIPNIRADVFSEYLELLRERQCGIDIIDVTIFSHYLSLLIDQKKFWEALKYIEVIKIHEGTMPPEQIVNYVFIDYLELNCLLNTRQHIAGIIKIRKIIYLMRTGILSLCQVNLLGQTGIDIIKQNIEWALDTEAKPVL